jgi:hypothetical protein
MAEKDDNAEARASIAVLNHLLSTLVATNSLSFGAASSVLTGAMGDLLADQPARRVVDEMQEELVKRQA